jgi:hypothetical protein
VAVASGTSYDVPSSGKITSWTTFSTGPAGQQWKLKIFRMVGDPAGSSYLVVGHSAVQTLTPGGTAGNTFPADIAVKAGDVLGLHNVSDNSKCAVLGAGSAFKYAGFVGDLADGASDVFGVASSARLDIQASFVPDNDFSLTKMKRNRNKGTAALSFNLPNAGTLAASGKGAKIAVSKSVPAGLAQLVVKAKGRQRRALNSSGKVKLKVGVTYTPTGGDPKTTKLKVKLLKK